MMCPRLIPALLLFSILLSTGARGQDVPAIDLASLSPAEFADRELDLPYYLFHFHTLANSVILEGPNRGFIDLSVWRRPQDNAPYNARIMENIVSLAYFFATSRPWNPYYGHPAVRERIEAALGYWARMQHPDGRYSEYGPDDWNLAATAFATKFMGETLRLLSAGPTIDHGILEAAIASQRRALIAVLGSDEWFALGSRFTNQYAAAWGGALAYLEIREDSELAELLEARLEASADAFQSPAGFFYEHGGPDWSYDIETHQSNHLMVWHYVQGTELEPIYIGRLRLWYDWFAHNTALETDASSFYVNHSFETRTRFPYYRDDRETMFGRTCFVAAAQIPMARGFCESLEDRDQRLERRRAQLEAAWPNVAPLQVGTFSAYSPYAFLHRGHVDWHPSNRIKQEALERLPYLRSDRFTHARVDDRSDMATLFIRRSSYYAVFSLGTQVADQQRFGLGLLWHPSAGALLQSDSGARSSWGTISEGGTTVYESDLAGFSIALDERETSLSPGIQSFEAATLTATYPLGDRGEKTVTFLEDEIIVRIRHDGPFLESIPLIVRPGEQVQSNPGLIEMPNLSIQFSTDAVAAISSPSDISGPGTVRTVTISGTDALTYRLRFTSP